MTPFVASNDLKIAFQGAPGSFTYLAVRQFFGTDHTFLSFSEWSVIAKQVANGSVRYGILPLENSILGTIRESLEILNRSPIIIAAEVYYRMDLNLLAVNNSTVSHEERLKGIRRAYSHYKSLEQCRNFFQQHPWIEPVIYSDTASAAQMVGDRNDPSLAAIASLESARLYNLTAIKRQVQNHPHNVSRFAIIASNEELKLPRGMPGSINEPINKATLLLNLNDSEHAILNLLSFLKEKNVRVSRIDSKPLRHDQEDYTLSLDIEFPSEVASQELEAFLSNLRSQVVTLKLLGGYHNASHDGWRLEPNP